jgi:hypothetical protein
MNKRGNNSNRSIHIRKNAQGAAGCVKQKIYNKKRVCVVSWISKTVKIRAKKE